MTSNIPKHVAGGDMPGGRTQIQELLDTNQWLPMKATVTPFQHYRLVLSVVRRPLTMFKCTKEIVQAIYDAMQAHWHAYSIMKILHYDISVGNIILTDDGHGLLIDWDTGKSDVGARRYDRTGTWQFMSAALLMDTSKMHTLSDDIESFIHVIGWLALRYIPADGTYPTEMRAADLTMFDDADCYVQGHPRGGKNKANTFCSGMYPSRDFDFKRTTPLSDLLSILCEPFRALYSLKIHPTDADRAKITVPTSKDDSKLIRLRILIEDYDEAVERLSSSIWFIETIDTALKDKEWPEDDGADDTVYKPSTGLLTEQQQQQQRTQRLLNSQSQFAAPKCSSGSSSSKRRPDSPTPEPDAKRRRGASAPVTPSSHMAG